MKHCLCRARIKFNNKISNKTITRKGTAVIIIIVKIIIIITVITVIIMIAFYFKLMIMLKDETCAMTPKRSSGEVVFSRAVSRFAFPLTPLRRTAR